MRTPVRLAWIALWLGLTSCGRDNDIASSCDDDDDCAIGVCYTESDPGYCTAECETEGSTAECPEFTVCKRIEGGPARCLLICEDVGDCPTNSECNSIPDSGGLLGCEPVF